MESSLSFFSLELCLWCHMWERLQSSPPRFSSFQFQVLHFSVPSILRSPLYMMQGTVHHSRRQMSWSFCWKRKIVPEYFFAFYLPHRAVESKFPGKLTTASYSLALRWILQWSTALPFWKGLEWAPALTFSSPLVWVSFIFLFLFFWVSFSWFTKFWLLCTHHSFSAAAHFRQLSLTAGCWLPREVTTSVLGHLIHKEKGLTSIQNWLCARNITESWKSSEAQSSIACTLQVLWWELLGVFQLLRQSHHTCLSPQFCSSLCFSLALCSHSCVVSFYLFVFGCIRSWLQHSGSSSCYRLSSCRARA